MIVTHKLLRTWHRAVSLFVAVSAFEKRKFVASGFHESKIVVKPNFVLDPGEPPARSGEHLLFVGRLAPEKGLRTLLRAVLMTKGRFRLDIVGDGPLQAEIVAAAALNRDVRYLGRLPQAQVLEAIGRARCLIFPSEWYETFGRVVAESFARGTPVIGSRIGAVAEIIDDGRTGLLFTPGDPSDLARAIDWVARRPDAVNRMRVQARLEFEAKYTAERNYDLMMTIFERAIAESRLSRCGY
jgi:glycosyltransferase involved in cell wall biosynthesis